MWLTLTVIAIELRPSAIQSMLFYVGSQTEQQCNITTLTAYKPLSSGRKTIIISMGQVMNNLKPLVWDWLYGNGGKTRAVCRAKSPSHEYIIRMEAGGDCYVDYRKFDNDEDICSTIERAMSLLKNCQHWLQYHDNLDFHYGLEGVIVLLMNAKLYQGYRAPADKALEYEKN